jgi:hypothetical protein
MSKRLKTITLPQSSVMQRLATFLPHLAESNRELMGRGVSESDHIDGYLEPCTGEVRFK